MKKTTTTTNKATKKATKNAPKMTRAEQLQDTIKRYWDYIARIKAGERPAVCISEGNRKIGAIKNVSLIPIFRCIHCEACAGICYALKSLMYENVRDAWARNTAIAELLPEYYFAEISRACRMLRVFRWHVAGDVTTPEYFRGVVRVAEENPHCEFLMFSKSYEIINEYINGGGVVPSNLHITLSDFEAFHCDNPHALPVTDVINHADELPAGGKLCGGNCTECVCRGVGCWELKKGERLYFVKH